MQKHLLLNAAGVAVLSLMCACGPLADKKEAEETKKEALAEIPESVQAAANEALAQAEPAPEGEEPVPGEESEAVSKVATAEPTEGGEPVEQKA